MRLPTLPQMNRAFRKQYFMRENARLREALDYTWKRLHGRHDRPTVKEWCDTPECKEIARRIASAKGAP